MYIHIIYVQYIISFIQTAEILWQDCIKVRRKEFVYQSLYLEILADPCVSVGSAKNATFQATCWLLCSGEAHVLMHITFTLYCCSHESYRSNRMVDSCADNADTNRCCLILF